MEISLYGIFKKYFFYGELRKFELEVVGSDLDFAFVPRFFEDVSSEDGYFLHLLVRMLRLMVGDDPMIAFGEKKEGGGVLDRGVPPSYFMGVFFGCVLGFVDDGVARLKEVDETEVGF